MSPKLESDTIGIHGNAEAMIAAVVTDAAEIGKGLVFVKVYICLACLV